MDTPVIRNVRIDDLPKLVDLCEQHAIYENATYDCAGKTAFLEESIFSENPPLTCLVIARQDQLIGYATFMKQFSTWDVAYYVYMDCLFLTEAARGFGLGKKLINQIKKETIKWNCSHIQWQTPSENVRAMKFYRRIGAKSKSKERFFLTV